MAPGERRGAGRSRRRSTTCLCGAPHVAEQLAELRGVGRRLAVLRQGLAKGARDVTHDRRLRAAVDLALADGRRGRADRPDGRGEPPAAAPPLPGADRLRSQAAGRLGRFQRALRELDGNGRRPIASVALRAGYFDQAHLARDFRLFAGVSAGAVSREARELARNFIADREAVGVMAQISVIPSERRTPCAPAVRIPTLRSG